MYSVHIAYSCVYVFSVPMSYGDVNKDICLTPLFCYLDSYFSFVSFISYVCNELVRTQKMLLINYFTRSDEGHLFYSCNLLSIESRNHS